MELNESDIHANGVKLHVYRTGAHKPPLVFAHGRSDNGLCFWPVARRFAADYEIILYDARDHGQSDKPKNGADLIDLVEDLAGLIAALALPKPRLIGHSLGAVTVALLAGLYPHIPACIVLEDPPPLELMAAGDEPAQKRHQGWTAYIAAIKEKSVAELVAMNRHDSPTWPEAEREPWAQSKRQYRPHPFGAGRIDAAFGNQLMSQITCPTLLLTADLDKGALFPPPRAAALVAGRANARHVPIPGAGHNIRREQPDAYLAVVADFLQAWA